MGKLALVLCLLSSGLSSALAADLKSFRLDNGRPGCWEDIRAGAMSAEEVKALASECQTLRADYLKSLELAEKKPAELLKKLNRTLIQAKKAAPPYEAILFAVLSASNEVKPGLEARAKIERKLGLPFRYADAALMRMEGKPCEDQVEFLHPFYREVCTGRDSILSASLTTLNHSVKKSVTK